MVKPEAAVSPFLAAAPQAAAANAAPANPFADAAVVLQAGDSDVAPYLAIMNGIPNAELLQQVRRAGQSTSGRVGPRARKPPPRQHAARLHGRVSLGTNPSLPPPTPPT